MKSPTAQDCAQKEGRWLLGLFFISASLVLFFSELGEKSMFIDGVWYAVIARNLSEGIGSFWFPQFSATIFPHFHEHPPLIFGVQSLFFQLFGDHWLTERLFSFCHYVMTGLFIVLLWRKATLPLPRWQYWWIIPLLLWQVNRVTYFFQPANLLDASVSLLSLVTIWCMWNAMHRRFSWIWLSTAGVLLGLAFLSKGVVALFPLAFLPLYAWIKGKQRQRQLLGYTFLVGISGLLFLAMLIKLSPGALQSLGEYVDVQLLASLKGERKLYYYRSNRFYIVIQLFWAVLPMLLLALASWAWVRWKKVDLAAANRERQQVQSAAGLFVAVGLSASLPIMISPRQAIPYLLPAIPYFSLAVGLWMTPYLTRLLMYGQQAWKRVFTGLLGFGYVAVCFGLVICVLKVGTQNSRDASVIADADLIGKVVGPQETISTTTYNMYISGYLMRYNKISIDTTNRQHAYLLSRKDEQVDASQYAKVPLPTQEYDLYQKITDKASYSQQSIK